MRIFNNFLICFTSISASIVVPTLNDFITNFNYTKFDASFNNILNQAFDMAIQVPGQTPIAFGYVPSHHLVGVEIQQNDAIFDKAVNSDIAVRLQYLASNPDALTDINLNAFGSDITTFLNNNPEFATDTFTLLDGKLFCFSEFMDNP